MKRLLLEDPSWLYVGLGVAEVVLFFLWRSAGTRVALRRLLYPPAVGLLVGLVAALVTTDRERIAEVTREIVRAGGRRDFAAVERHLAASFRGPEGAERAATMERARSVASRYELASARLGDLVIEVDEARPRARARAVLILAFRRLRQGVSMRWRVDTRWARRGERWLVTEATVRGPW